MSNIFLPLPTPAGNGPGAAVDMSLFGSTKTVTVSNLAGSIVSIEISNDDLGTKWTPIGTLQTVAEKTFEIACHWMRAVVSNFKGPGAPIVEVGGTNDGTLFAQLNVPAGNGVGASVDVSTLGLFKTIQVSGPVTGTVAIEISEDGGVTFATAFLFSAAGEKSQVIAASNMRVKRTGATGGLPLVNVAATTPGSGTNVIPTPPFGNNVNTIIYVRTTGSDTEGNGKTPATAYLTLPRGVRDVPFFIPPGFQFTVNTTGLGDETLPNDYELPSWKGNRGFQVDFADPFFPVSAAVNLRSDPQLVPSLGADATINLADVATVGGGIAAISGPGSPITITTNVPHGLPLGVNSVTIMGSGNPDADGTWIITVTGASTFDLTSNLFGVVSSTGNGPSSGGTVYKIGARPGTLAQITIEVTVARPSWTAGPGIVGKTVYGQAFFEDSVVFDVTTTTISLTTNSVPTFPVQIMEPSTRLHGNVTINSFQAGAVTIIEVDSLTINGFAIDEGSGGQSIFVLGGATNWFQGCDLPNFYSSDPVRAVVLKGCNLDNPSLSGPVYAFHTRIANELGFGTFFALPATGIRFSDGIVIDNCTTIKVLDDTGVTSVVAHGGAFSASNTLIRNSQGDAIYWPGGNLGLINVEIDGATGDGIVGQGGLQSLLIHVTGTVLGAVGIRSLDGAQIQIDSTTTLTGANDQQVGNLAPGAYPVGLFNIYDNVGATATGARLFRNF